MAKKKNFDEYTQLNLFDTLETEKDLDKYSSKEIERAINKLLKAKELAKNREKNERLRKEKEEAERKAKEEKERREAHIKKVTCMDLPMDWNNVFDGDNRTQGVHEESISDALVMSLNTLGKVDIEYISSITGSNYKTVICSLKGSIYQNPLTWNECFYKGWETSEEYLSGNLMKKLKEANEANLKYDGYFADNIEAIKKVLPPLVNYNDIYITLGSPWVPSDIIDDFIVYLFGDPFVWDDRFGDSNISISDQYKTIHDEITGTWEIPYKNRYFHSVKVSNTYGIERLEALYILEKTLNMKTISVKDEIYSPTNASGKKRVINKIETLEAIDKQQKLIKAFQDWVWVDSKRKERLETIFENNFGCIRKRLFDGSFLNFPTMSKSINLYPYQKDAVARIIFTSNTLLAHDVGAGKTYIMIAAGQKMKRMGLSKKNMYVVPNNIVGQWKNIFLTMYPGAKLLCVEPKNFIPEKRLDVLKQIRDEDYDGIIIAYSCFEEIPLSKKFYIDKLKAKKDVVSKFVAQKDKATSTLKKKEASLNKALYDMFLTIDYMYDTIYFDELGINRLFVDEAHNFKNVPFETKTDNVLGINSKGSNKCQDMLDKVHMIQKENGGKGVIFATGTPITNSITDVYNLQQYLQNGELALLDLQNFDSWIGMFAERSTEFEIDVDTSSYRLATRFSKFHNLPELTSLLSSIADFHQVDNLNEVPKLDGYNDTLVFKTKEFTSYLQEISQRADNVRQGVVNRNEDNMLKITTDGRKAALDIRLVDPSVTFSCYSKVFKCSENVANIFFKTMQNNLTQLIFCDISTPKSGFNIYDEIKRCLISFGVPSEKIAYIHDVETETKRSQMFLKVRNGEIRILIGSTFKLGLGVNIQDKLIALHHLDVPWRPADMVQREGRILRQGNTNGKVYIYRYITEGSFDAYSWQLLETKQRFISDLLSGSVTERSSNDIEDTVLDYAEVKALAIGNPLVKERVEANNTLSKFITLQRKLIDSRISMKKELLELPAKINHQKDLILKCEEDNAFYHKFEKTNLSAIHNSSKKEENEKRKVLRENITSSIRNHILESKEKTITSYKGFEIVLPANMTLERPYIYLIRKGKYFVELGDTEVGNLVRIDNYLDTLGEHVNNLKKTLVDLINREKEITIELNKNEDYTEQINIYKKKVEILDEKLGVNKK